MQVILLEKVNKLGSIGSIVDVKPGFARNFLLPRNKALRATEENKKLFELKKQEIEKENQDLIRQATSDLQNIDGISVVLIRQAGEDGKLFGSVSTKDIADAVNAKSDKNINKNHIMLNTSIKYVGKHSVSIVLHPEVHGQVYVIVARTEDEAETVKNKVSVTDKPKEPIETTEIVEQQIESEI
jgi:large subunit ribosomal protein L9